jgi:hypothetical protein
MLHYTHEPVTPFVWADTAGVAFTRDLIAAGLLIEKNLDPGTPENIVITPRGKAFVDMLCQTPIPVQRWADPREGQA